uniref:Uncharacterized protein n=1 Tax=Coptotermes formosanus TaxID=36987 RepID=R4UX96_COPFO|nr:hypothetical protein [Coptotermes formosanus]
MTMVKILRIWKAWPVTLTRTVYSKHFSLNPVEVSLASRVARFLVDSLSSLDKKTYSCSVGCYNIPLVLSVLLLQCQMMPLTVLLESKHCRYYSHFMYMIRLLGKCELVWYLNYFLFLSGTGNVHKLSVSSP